MTYSKNIPYYEFIIINHARECSLVIQLDFFPQFLNVRRQLFSSG